jgi:iron complex transport system permease protein
VFLVSRSGRALAPTQLILCGVVLSALFESVTSFLIFRGNPQGTQAVLFWLLGSFGLANWQQLPIPAVVLAGAIGYLITRGRALNALALGPGPAAALGLEVRVLRRNLFIVTSLMAGRPSWWQATCWPGSSSRRRRCRSASSPRSSGRRC